MNQPITIKRDYYGLVDHTGPEWANHAVFLGERELTLTEILKLATEAGFDSVTEFFVAHPNP